MVSLNFITCTYLLLRFVLSANLVTGFLCPTDTVFLRIYCSNSTNYEDFGITNTSQSVFSSECYNKELLTFVLIHGISGSVNGPFIKEAVTALFRIRGNHLALDWNKNSYLYSLCMEETADAVSRKLNEAIENGNLIPSHMHLIGFSSGAHLSGSISNKLSKKVAKITGLDPAGPIFDQNLAEKVCSGDGYKVTNTHTSRFTLGSGTICADCDILFNTDGMIQPGSDVFEYHIKALKYVTDMIINGNYMCQKCDSYTNFVNGKCSNLPKYNWSLSGEICNGKCYLITNKDPPYGRGLAGTVYKYNGSI